MAERVVYQSELDPKQVLDALNRIENKLQDTEDRGDKAFKGIGKGAALAAGAALGAVAAVNQLVDALVNVASAATRAFADFIKGGIELNREAELTRIALTNIFEGNEDAANAFISLVDEVAVKLGANRGELRSLAKGILPDVGDIDTTTQLLENLIILGKDAGKGFDDIRISAEEALSGNLKSLQRRLNIPERVLQNAERYAETLGVAGGLAQALSERVEESGLSAESTAGSFDALVGQFESLFANLQTTTSSPVFDELKEQGAELLQILKDNEEEIGDFAFIIGQLVANVVEFVGTGLNDFLQDLDFDELVGLGEDLLEATNQTIALVDALFDLPETEGGIEGTRESVQGLATALESATRNARILKTSVQAGETAVQALIAIQTGNINSLLDATGEAIVESEELSKAIFGIGEAQKSVDQAEEDAETRRERRRKQREDERRKREVDTDRAKKEADAILARQKAEREAADAAIEAAEAREKIAEKTAKAIAKQEEDLARLRRDFSNQAIEDAIRNSERRADIERRNLQRIADIERKNQQAIADAGRDLGRDESDARRDAERRRADLERDLASERVSIDRQAAQRRLDIERDFQRQLRDIQTTFQRSALEAERSNDVQAFLAAQRRRDDDIADAKQAREDSVSDVATERQSQLEEAKRSAREQREALKRQLEQELADARLANERKLEDLQLRLERELLANSERIDREREQQAIAEQRQTEQRQRAFERELAEFAIKENSRIAKLKESLAKEIELVAEAEKKKADIRVREARRAIEAAKSITRSIGRSFGGSRSSSSSLPIPSLPVILKRDGPTSNRIPTPQTFNPPVSPTSIGGNIDNSRSIDSPSFHLSQSMLDDPIERAKLSAFVQREIGGTLSS